MKQSCRVHSWTLVYLLQSCCPEQSWNSEIISPSIFHTCRQWPEHDTCQPEGGAFQSCERDNNQRSHQPELCPYGATPCSHLNVWSPWEKQIWCWPAWYLHSVFFIWDYIGIRREINEHNCMHPCQVFFNSFLAVSLFLRHSRKSNIHICI